MRVIVHDFAGHPFQVQLSRTLAMRGHTVLHLYPAGLPGPKGMLDRRPEDSVRFRVEPVTLPSYFQKYSPIRRLAAHQRYAADLRSLLDRETPDVVLSANTPVDIQSTLVRHCRERKIGFVHWMQDLYCQAVKYVLRRRVGPLSKIAAIPFRRIEASLSRRCDEIIVIAPAFIEALIGMNVPRTKITLVENWASLDEVFPLSQQNPWHQSMRLGERPVFLYSGTLGLKHRPDLLYKLAQALGERGQVVVISEGVGRNHLERLPKLDNLTMLDFQPYERLPEVLASADVLLATLETDAGSFAVPSKVLAYLCAGRPVLLAAPPNNLSSDIIRRSGGGIAVDPAAEQTLIQAALQLAQDAILRAELGANARSYAEKNFDIQRIAATFERILAKTIPELDTAPTGPRILTPR